jgi:hypothetical protein
MRWAPSTRHSLANALTRKPIPHHDPASTHLQELKVVLGVLSRGRPYAAPSDAAGAARRAAVARDDAELVRWELPAYRNLLLTSLEPDGDRLQWSRFGPASLMAPSLLIGMVHSGQTWAV